MKPSKLYYYIYCSQMWLGITDQYSEGTFVYESTRKVVPYNYFKPPDPNNDGNEDCVVSYPIGNQFLWLDYSCGISLIYVCEFHFQ